MDSVSVTLLPSGLWILAQSLVILIMLVGFGHHLYFKQRSQAFLSDAEDVTDLAAKKQMLEAEKNELSLWLSEQNQNILKLKGEREEQERLRTEIEQLKEACAKKEQELATIKNSLGDLGSRNYVQEQVFKNLLENVDKLEEKKGEIQRQLEPDYERYREIGVRIDDARDELSRVRSDIDDLTTRLNEKNQALEQTEITRNDLLLQTRLLENRKKELEIDVEESERTLDTVQINIEVTQAELAGLKSKTVSLNERLNEKTEALNKFQEKRDALEIQTSLLDNRKQELQIDVQELGDKLKSTRAKFDEAWADLLTLRSETENLNTRRDEELAAIERLTNKKDVLNQEISQIEQTKKTATSEIERLQKYVSSVTAQLEHSRQRVLELEKEISHLEALKANLEGFVADHNIQEEMTEKSLEDLLIIPPCLGGKTRATTKITENKALENVRESLEKMNLSYSWRVLKSFHTNLKISHISPMVALAGISGTGKSELPKRYAEAMGFHFLQMAVQPRWDSPQDLFGFYNYLEQRYKATELARAMVRLDRWNWADYAKSYQDKILLVLLDEMNLARVEYYFSEFLSRLEGRKSVNPEDDHSRKPVEMELDLGRKRGETGTKRVFPSQNVLFVGTMNEDESTQSMSDKVIDRAPVIRFARPKVLADRPPQPQNNSVDPSSYLPLQTWLQWRRDLDSLSRDVRDNIEKWINRLNKELDVFGRPFGHRLNQAILAYVANHPDMISDPSLANARKAFADQLEQRIFPKLRGLEMEDNNLNDKSYKQILALVKEDLKDEELADALDKSKRNILFTWVGVNREEEK